MNRLSKKAIFLLSILCWSHVFALSWSRSDKDMFGTQTVNNVEWTFKYLEGGGVALSTSSYGYAPAVPKDQTIGAIVIPAELGGQPVVALGPYSFQNCSMITSLTIPATVKGVYWNVFGGTESLKELEIPDTVEEIAGSAFDYDYGIEVIKLPKELKVIQSRTFIGCANLRTVVWPENYEEIGSDAFEYCGSLEEVTIPASCTTIGDSAFEGAGSIKRINLSENNQSFGFSGGCLYRLSDKSIVATLGGEELVVPDGAVSIPEHAFYEHYNLEKVDVPATVLAIGYSCFGNCTGLKMIVFHGAPPIGLDEAGFGKSVSIRHNPQFSDEWESAAEANGLSDVKPYDVVDPTNPDAVVTNLVKGCYYVKGEFVGVCKDATKVVLPESVIEIPKSMLAGCGNLSDITIPSSVSSIEAGAFQDCAADLTINGNAKSSFSEVSTVNGLPLPTFNAVAKGLEMDSAIATGLITPSNVETVSIQNGVMKIGIVVEKATCLEKNRWEPIKQEVLEVQVPGESGFYRFKSKGN